MYLLCSCGFAIAQEADTLKIALFHTDLSRAAPAQLLRDLHGDLPHDVRLAIRRGVEANADILMLADIDGDRDHLAALALRDHIAQAGLSYPHMVMLRSNAGRLLEIGEPAGYGDFEGAGGMMILSKFKIFDHIDLRDWTCAQVRCHVEDPRMVLSSRVMGVVGIEGPMGPVWIGIGHATPPAFDGPEDRNGWRNLDQITFWSDVLDGVYDLPSPDIIALLANIDPIKGEGRKEGIIDLITHPSVIDPRPMGCHADRGCSTDTAHWPDPGPGSRRSDYLLATRSWRVMNSGLDWGQAAAEESRHALVWLRIRDAQTSKRP